MRAPLPFDEKNAEDFFKISKAINEALAVIRENKKMEPSQSNLSKLSGVHRNTLRNRRWPLEELAKIKEERASGDVLCTETKAEKEQKLFARTIDDLKKKLELSREEAAKWFHKTLAYEAEIEALKNTNELLNQKLDAQKKSVGEHRKNSNPSHISILRG
ncbi:hypothetical protein EBS43_04430 [bacterium]|nr:hypothetical protein [bacterium]